MRRRLPLAAVVLPLIAASTATGQTVLRRGYSVDRWSTENGLPQNSVNAILQSRDGSLWLATLGGVARFDGQSFTTITTNDRLGLPSDRVQALAEDRAGVIWIGTDNGLSRFDRRTVKTFSTADQLPSNSITGLAAHPDGSLWVGAANGALARVVGERVETIPRSPTTFGGAIRAIEIDTTGIVWVSAETGVWRIDSPSSTPLLMLERRHRPIGMTRLAAAGEFVWAIGDSGLVRLSRTGIEHMRSPSRDLLADSLRAIAASADDGLWLTTQPGDLFRFDPRTRTTERVASAIDPSLSLLVDREGSVWMGGRIEGLTRVRRSIVEGYAAAEGLGYLNIASVFADSRGRVWVSAKCSGIFYLEGTRFVALPHRPPTRCGYAFMDDRAGGVWIGGERLVRWSPGRITMVADSGFGPIYAMQRGAGDTLWLGTPRGLGLWDGRRLHRLGDPNDTTVHIRTLVPRRAGGFWVGTGAGLWKLEVGARAPVAIATTTGMVRGIYEDSSGTVWIATYGGGLGVLRRDSMVVLTTADGLGDNFLSSIADDGVGNMWFSSDRGVFRVAIGDLEQRLAGVTSRVRSATYGKSDGMPSSETNGGYQSSVARTSDGRLWYPTLLGLASIDPGNALSAVSPTVTIDQIIVNGVPVDGSDSLRLGPGVSDVEIRYSGMSLNSPSTVTYRYRLEGWDTRWIEAGTQRAAHYSRLDHGSYRFRVMAANRDGVWSRDEAALPFSVTPRLWQRGWFQLAALLALAALVFGAFQVRLRQVRLEEQRNALARQNETLAENVRLKDEVERISRHDLRTPLASIVSLSQIIRDEPGLSGRHLASLSLIEQAAYRVLNMANRTLDLFKMEQGTYRLSPKAIDIRAAAERSLVDLAALLRTKGVRCTIQVDGPARHRPLIQGDELLAHSMLTNLIKNAIEASAPGGEVSIIITDADPVRVAVHNDGEIPESIRSRFFEKYATDGKKGGTGLGAYSARLMAETQGGRIGVETSADRGTTITVELLPADALPAPPEELTVATSGERPAGWPPRSILVVDDDEQNRMILRHFLEHPRWNVDEAENGPVAIRRCAETAYDVVFMDVEMPVMDGLETTRAIRALEIATQPRIIALSSHDDEFIPRRARESGCNEYLVKPVTAAVITDFVLGDASVIAPAETGADAQPLVPAFLVRKRAEVDALAASIAAGDAGTAAARAHRLRGSFSLYGFPDTSQICAEIEAHLRDGRLNDASALVPRLATSVDQLKRLHPEPT